MHAVGMRCEVRVDEPDVAPSLSMRDPIASRSKLTHGVNHPLSVRCRAGACWRVGLHDKHAKAYA